MFSHDVINVGSELDHKLCSSDSNDEEFEIYGLIYMLPSCRKIMHYLEDASYLNLEHVAQQMYNKLFEVITTGFDDTNKAKSTKTLSSR